MERIINYFDDHMEVWGAIAFGVLAFAACVALAAAINGVL